MKKIFSTILILCLMIINSFTADISSMLPPISTNKTVTSTLAVGPPSIAFYDDFSTNNGSWQFKDGAWSITNGVLTGTIPSGIGSYAFITNTFTNMFLEARMRFVGSNQWGMSLSGRYRPSSGANIAEWIYATQLQSTIERYSDWYNIWTALASKSNPNPGTNWHLFQLSISNNTYQSFIDSNLVNTVTDNTSTNTFGGAAISMWASGGTTTIEIDYVSVSTNFNTITPPPIIIPPSFANKPSNLIVTQGLSATFSANASGTTPLTYQWIFNGSKLIGATNSTLTISNAQPSNQGNYTLRVSNSGGITNSLANLTVALTNVLTSCYSVSNKNWATVQWCSVAGASGYKIYMGSGILPKWDGDCIVSSNDPCIIISCGTNLFRSYTNSIDAGLMTSMNVSNLISNTAYFFAASSYDVNGIESGLSAETRYLTTQTNTLNPTLNVTLTIQSMPPANTPRVMCKVCPNTSIQLLKATKSSGPYNVWTNVVSDVYGNVIVDDTSTTQAFYRAKQL